MAACVALAAALAVARRLLCLPRDGAAERARSTHRTPFSSPDRHSRTLYCFSWVTGLGEGVAEGCGLVGAGARGEDTREPARRSCSHFEPS